MFIIIIIIIKYHYYFADFHTHWDILYVCRYDICVSKTIGKASLLRNSTLGEGVI